MYEDSPSYTKSVKPNITKTYFVFKTMIENQTLNGDGCNGIMFVNQGVAVNINGLNVAVGQTLALNGNALDQDFSSYQLIFSAVVGRNLIVIQKFNTFE